MVTEVMPQADETSKLDLRIVGDTPFLDREECRELGKSLHDEYVSNDPFPHIVIDNFLPLDALRRVVAEFPDRKSPRFNDAQSKLKTGYQMEAIESPFITNLFNAMNSSQFIEFLEEMTGIKGLVPDPHFAGGGLHETATGGHLSIHADFNLQRRLNLRRRMNLILFLNENWQDEYGGHLELWSTDMKERRKSVAPVIGRAVIFNTEEDSYHGHPDPTTSPPDVYRRSMALYYYTALDTAVAPQYRTTQFKPRPGSKDARPPARVRMVEVLRDCVPPILARRLFKDGF